MTPSNRRLWVLSACLFLLYAGNGISFPFLAMYLNETRGVPAQLVGLVLSTCMLANALGQAMGGEASDRWGRKRTMLGALFWRSGFVALLGWTVGHAGFSLLASVHLIYSLVGSFFEPASRSWVADHFTPKERLKAYGFLRLAPNLGWAVGPAIGSVVPLESYPKLFYVSAAASLACAGLVAALIQEGGATKPAPVEPAGLKPPCDVASPGLTTPAAYFKCTDPRFLRYCLWSLLISMVMAQLVVSLSIHCTRFLHLSHRQIGLLFSVNGLLVVLLQTWATDYFARFRLTSALAAGSLFYAVGYAAVGFADSYGPMLAAIVLVTLGEIVISPSMTTLAANIAPAGARGRYLGLQGLAAQFGMALGPLSGGWALSYLSPHGSYLPWLGVGLVALVAAAGFLSLEPSLEPQENSPHLALT